LPVNLNLLNTAVTTHQKPVLHLRCTETVWWSGSAWTSYESSQRSPDLLTGFKGWGPRERKRMGSKGMKGEGEWRKRERKERREGGRQNGDPSF